MGYLAERVYRPDAVLPPPEGEGAASQVILPVEFLEERGSKVDAVATLTRFSKGLNKNLLRIGAVSLVMMIALTCGNIFLRIVWMPVKGTFELMGFFSAVVTAFSLGYTQMQKAHTGIDVFVNLFSEKTRRTLNGINNLILTVFFFVLGWQLLKWGTTLWRAGEVSETLRIAFYPFVYGVGVGCFGLALALLVELSKTFGQEKGS